MDFTILDEFERLRDRIDDAPLLAMDKAEYYKLTKEILNSLDLMIEKYE